MPLPQHATETTPARHATILLGHGSRDPLWREPMERMAEAAARHQPQRPVCCAYLELCEPDVFAATAQLRATHPGLRSIVLYPVFIGMGTHARQDLPQLCEQLGAQHPGLQFTLAPALGTDARLIELVAQIVGTLD